MTAVWHMSMTLLKTKWRLNKLPYGIASLKQLLCYAEFPFKLEQRHIGGKVALKH
jgi:hypothetical protein